MDKKTIVARTIEYIEQQLISGREVLSLDEVADEIGFSKFYLNRVFQEHVKTTIYQYILERRLTEAARQLIDTDNPIVDIAYDAGYQSQQAFTNAFSTIYHCTPMKYRMRRQFIPLRKPYQARCISVGCRMEAAA